MKNKKLQYATFQLTAFKKRKYWTDFEMKSVLFHLTDHFDDFRYQILKFLTLPVSWMIHFNFKDFLNHTRPSGKNDNPV